MYRRILLPRGILELSYQRMVTSILMLKRQRISQYDHYLDLNWYAEPSSREPILDEKFSWQQGD